MAADSTTAKPKFLQSLKALERANDCPWPCVPNSSGRLALFHGSNKPDVTVFEVNEQPDQSAGWFQLACGVCLTSDPKAAKSFAKFWKNGGTPTIYEVEVCGLNILDASTMERLRAVFCGAEYIGLLKKKFASAPTYELEREIRFLEHGIVCDPFFGYFSTSYVEGTRFLYQHGYDGVKCLPVFAPVENHTDKPDICDEWDIFDPSNIRVLRRGRTEEF